MKKRCVQRGKKGKKRKEENKGIKIKYIVHSLKNSRIYKGLLT